MLRIVTNFVSGLLLIIGVLTYISESKMSTQGKKEEEIIGGTANLLLLMDKTANTIPAQRWFRVNQHLDIQVFPEVSKTNIGSTIQENSLCLLHHSFIEKCKSLYIFIFETVEKCKFV